MKESLQQTIADLLQLNPGATVVEGIYNTAVVLPDQPPVMFDNHSGWQVEFPVNRVATQIANRPGKGNWMVALGAGCEILHFVVDSIRYQSSSPKMFDARFIAWDAEGERFAAASVDGYFGLWFVDGDQLLHYHTWRRTVGSDVIGLKWRPDGSVHLLTEFGSGTIGLVPTVEELRTLRCATRT